MKEYWKVRVRWAFATPGWVYAQGVEEITIDCPPEWTQGSNGRLAIWIGLASYLPLWIIEALENPDEDRAIYFEQLEED